MNIIKKTTAHTLGQLFAPPTSCAQALFCTQSRKCLGYSSAL